MLSCAGCSFHSDQVEVVRLYAEMKDGCLPSEEWWGEMNLLSVYVFWKSSLDETRFFSCKGKAPVCTHLFAYTLCKEWNGDKLVFVALCSAGRQTDPRTKPILSTPIYTIELHTAVSAVACFTINLISHSVKQTAYLVHFNGKLWEIGVWTRTAGKEYFAEGSPFLPSLVILTWC